MSVTTRTPIQVLQSAWKRIAPLELADTAWDNVGVMIEAPYPKQSGKTALLTIDLTTAVCEEALAMPDCSLIISYHPTIFSGLKKITLANTLQASLLRLSAKGISVFSPHTSLDAVDGGINTFLASPFQHVASSSSPITPKYKSRAEVPEHLASHSEAGMGMIVKLKEGSEMELGGVVQEVKKLLGLKYVQVATPSNPPPIKTLAFCAGSGSSVFKGCEADVYITGEMSHHDILPIVAAGHSLIVCNHSNSERPYLDAVLKDWLRTELNEEPGEKGWVVVVSKADKDPLETV